MTIRRLLVFDNDLPFIKMLHDLLEPYEFEVHNLEVQPKEVSQIKIIKPNIIFIAVDDPDRIGFTICTMVKKVVVHQLPVVLFTSTISEYDMSMHQKQKFNADLYLDKRSLTSEVLLEKLDTLITLGPWMGVFSEEDDSKDLFVNERPDGSGQHGTRTKSGKKPYRKGDSEVFGNLPPWLSKLMIDVSEDGVSLQNAETYVEEDIEGIEDGDDDDRTIGNGKKDVDGLFNQLAEREDEIRELKLRLEDALVTAKSSPFSNDFILLREELRAQKKQIVKLTEEEHEKKHQLKVAEGKVRELAKRLLKTSTELERALERQEIRTIEFETERTELAWIRAEFEEFKQKATEYAEMANEKLSRMGKEYEKKTRTLEAEYQAAAMRSAESKYKKDLKALEKRRDAEIARAQEIAKQEYAGRLTESENTFKVKVSELEKTCRELEESINSYKSDIEKKGKKCRELEETVMHQKVSLEKLQDEHEKTLTFLRNERSELLREHESKFKEEQNQLVKDHAAKLGEIEEQHKMAIAALEKMLTKEKEQALEKMQKQYSGQFEERSELLCEQESKFKEEHDQLVKDYVAELGEKEEQHKMAIAALGKKLTKEKEQALEKIRKQHASQIDEMVQKHEARLLKEQERAYQDLEEKHRKNIQAIEERLAREKENALKEVEKRFQSTLKEKEQSNMTVRREYEELKKMQNETLSEREQNLSDQLDRQKESHAKEIEIISQKLAESLKKIETLETEKETKLTEAKEKFRQKVTEYNDHVKAQIVNLKKENEKAELEKKKLEKAFEEEKKSHEQTVNKYKEKLLEFKNEYLFGGGGEDVKKPKKPSPKESKVKVSQKKVETTESDFISGDDIVNKFDNFFGLGG